MKPLSEVRDKWQRQASTAHPIDEFQAANFHFERGRQYCAVELEAWLREADTELLRNIATEDEENIVSSWVMWIRDKVLGTYPGTPQEGEK